MTIGVLNLLETFPGWPAVDEPSNFFLFMLCLGAPLLVGVVLAVLVLGHGNRDQAAEVDRAAGLSLSDPEPARTPALRHAIESQTTDAAPRALDGAHAAH